MKTVMSLSLIVDHSKILLGKKKIGFGQGRWLAGFGGKREIGETIEETAIREVREETGLEILAMDKVGVYEADWQNNSRICEVHIFKITDYRGEPCESDEIAPRWFELNSLPVEQMWPDVKYWLPLFLEDKKFKGNFFYSQENQVVDYKINL